MKSENKIELKGKVLKALPGGRFLVEVNGKHKVTAHIAGRIRKFFIQVMAGDMGKLEISPYDPTKGRIIYRYYDENESIEEDLKEKEDES